MRSDFATSAIRTGTGYLVAWVLALPAAPAIEHAAGVSAGEAKTAITAGLVFVLGSGYYAAVRRVEQRWPAAGRLLGIARPPNYDAASEPPADGGAHDAETIARLVGAELVDAEPLHSAP